MATSTSTSRSASSGRRQSGSDGGGTGASRLPSTRERRPLLAALGVLLIAGGALASAWLALQVSDRAQYLRIANDAEVPQGGQITEEVLEEVSLPVDLDEAVPAADAEDLIGQYSTTRLIEGTILTDNMIAPDREPEAGFSIVGARFSNGEVTNLATNGAQVLISLPELSGEEGGSPGSVPATITSLQLPEDDSITSSGGGDTVASFLVAADCVDEVTDGFREGGVYVGLDTPEAAQQADEGTGDSAGDAAPDEDVKLPDYADCGSSSTAGTTP